MQYSLTRIRNLFRKTWVENQKLYLLGILTIIGIMSLTLLITINLERTGFTQNTRNLFFFAGMLAFGAVYASTFSKQLSGKPNRIQTLTLPVSGSEHLTVALIYCILLFPLVYFVTVGPIWLLMSIIYPYGINAPDQVYSSLPMILRVAPAFLILQSFFLLCATVFRAYAFLKAAVLMCLIFFGTMTVNGIIAKNTGYEPSKQLQIERQFYDEYNVTTKVERFIKTGSIQFAGAFPFSETKYIIKDTPNVAETELPAGYRTVFKILFYGTILFLWLITWFKFRETQL